MDPTLDDVVTALALRFGVAAEDVWGADRSPRTVIVRHLSMLIGMRILAMTQTDLANKFKRRHTGIGYATEKASRRLSKDPAVYKACLEVLESLGLPRQVLPIRDPDGTVDAGLMALHPRTDGELSVFERIAEAETVDMALTTGSHLLAAIGNEIGKAIEHGCKVRLAVTDPTSARNAAWCTDPDIERQLEWTFAQLRALALGLAQSDALGSLEVKLRRTPPTCSLMIRDGAFARWTPLLPKHDTKHSPSLDFVNVANSTVFPQLQEAFDEIWNDPENQLRGEVSYAPASEGRARHTKGKPQPNARVQIATDPTRARRRSARPI
jgi:hypothetical protein